MFFIAIQNVFFMIKRGQVCTQLTCIELILLLLFIAQHERCYRGQRFFAYHFRLCMSNVSVLYYQFVLFYKNDLYIKYIWICNVFVYFQLCTLLSINAFVAYLFSKTSTYSCLQIYLYNTLFFFSFKVLYLVHVASSKRYMLIVKSRIVTKSYCDLLSTSFVRVCTS